VPYFGSVTTKQKKLLSKRTREAVRERRTVVTVLVDVTQTRNSGTELCSRLTCAQDIRADKRDVLHDILGKKRVLIFVYLLKFVIGAGKLVQEEIRKEKKILLGSD
jgi:hypothetical protein